MPEFPPDVPFKLIGPTYTENAWTRDVLFGRILEPHGITLAIKGTVVTEFTFPWAGDIYPGGNAAPTPDWDHVYLGGHHWPLSQQEADNLIAAGYGEFVFPND